MNKAKQAAIGCAILVAVIAIAVFIFNTMSIGQGTSSQIGNHAATSMEAGISSKGASAIAEQAFLREYKQLIQKYRVGTAKLSDDRASWVFFFQGTEEYARPGYHATVIVNRQTGATRILHGE